MALIIGPVTALLSRFLTQGVLQVGIWVAGSFGTLFGPLLGAGAVALLVLRVAHVGGTGTDIYIASVHGTLRPPSPLQSVLKLLATVITVGSGGSGGLVGPSIFIGSSFFRSLWIWKRLAPYDRQSLMVMGSAAMLGALLHTPIAAAILVIEVLRRSAIEYPLLVPALMGGIAGHWCSVQWWGAMQRATDLIEHTPHLLVVAALTAACGGYLSIAFVHLFRWIQSRAMRQYFYLWMLTGGLLTGVLGWLIGTELQGWGMPELFAYWTGGEHLGMRSWLLALGKMVATAFTVGPGGSGGVIGPALVMGTFLGNGMAAVSGLSLTALAITGKAACLAGISNVPVAAAILMIEMFGSSVAVYAGLGSAIGFFIAQREVAYSSLMTPGDLP